MVRALTVFLALMVGALFPASADPPPVVHMYDTQYGEGFPHGAAPALCGQPARIWPMVGTIEEVSVAVCATLNGADDCRHVEDLATYDINGHHFQKRWYCATEDGFSPRIGPLVLDAVPLPCEDQLDVSRNLSTEVTLNPAATIPAVCYQGCKFDISTASNYTFGSGSHEKIFRMGEWIGSGTICEGDPAGVTDPTPGGDDGGVEGDCNPETEDCDFPDIPDEADTCGDADFACQEAKRQLEITKYTDLEGTDGKPQNKVLGAHLQFPDFPFFHVQGERVCTLAIPNPVQGFMRAALGGDNITINFCPHLNTIDRIGGWFLYFLTAMTMWGLFMRQPGSA